MTDQPNDRPDDRPDDRTGDEPTQTGEFGPMPTPTIEPGETSPGGPDAVAQPQEVVAADLAPDQNPTIEQSPPPVKQALAEGEDTGTDATRSDGSDNSDQSESTA